MCDEENKENSVVCDSVPPSKAVQAFPSFWQYELTKDSWVFYSDDVIKKLNDAPSDGVVGITLEEAELDIDLSSMKQINKVSSFRRKVRCCLQVGTDEYIAWEVKCGRWYVYLPKNIQLDLETLKKEEQGTFTLTFDNEKCDVDFLKMEVRNENGTVKKLRRTECTAASGMSAIPTVLADKTRGLTKRSAKSVEYKKEVKEEIKEEFEKATKSKKSKYFDESYDSKSNKKSIILNQHIKLLLLCISGTVKSTSDFYKSTKRVLLVKGRAPVDPECSEKIQTAHVLDEGSCVWDAMLNQTNIAQNNNKFYILQLLEDDNAKNYSVWFRWGRVGYQGQSNLFTFGSDLDAAKDCFCKKFRDKTHNDWSDRHDFERVHGKYTLIQMDYNVQKNDENKAKDEIESEDDMQIKKEEDEDDFEDSNLDERIRNFLALICNRQTMEEAALELEYDSARAPLGRLTQDQIEEGYRLLSDIEKCIKKQQFGKDFVNYVNEYYTKIPHNFGFRQPPLIKTEEMLKKEGELLEFLQEIEIAIRTLGSGKKKGDKRDPLDRYYDNMNCEMKPLSNTDEEFKMVEKYLQVNHATTHMYTMSIINIFRVHKKSEEQNFKHSLGNKMLLWHGSRLTNWYGILSQGLRIAPPEAPSCGYMFGKGIYFADMASKSGNYCYPASGKPGVLLLSEVALGENRNLRDADYSANKLPVGKHSTIGEGATIPNPSEHITLENDMVVPIGKPTKRKEDGPFSLLYNEFVVYDTAQVKMRYVVEVEFDM